jgi:hypothetical protein
MDVEQGRVALTRAEPITQTSSSKPARVKRNRSGAESATDSTHARFRSVSRRSSPPSAPHTKTSAGATVRLAANASVRPSADAENPFSTRSPPTIRWGAALPVAAARHRPMSPRSSAATVSDRPSGDQEGRTWSAPHERSSAELRHVAWPPSDGTVKS